MSSLASVRTAWDAVLANATLTAYSGALYNYDIVSTIGVGEINESLLMYSGQLNFAQFVFDKTHNFDMIKEVKETFDVAITYYLEMDIDGDNFHAVTDFFDDLFEVVRTELGTSWTDTIDFYTMDDVSVASDELTGKQCWVATQNYVGTNHRNL